MPRVLRIINRLNLGGPTYNVAYLTKYLAPEFETILVTGTKLDDEESSEFILEKMGIKPVMISEMKRQINPVADYKAYSEIKKLIKEFKPDIVHTHAAKSGTVGRLAAIHCNVPVIIHTFHGHVFHSYFNPVKTKIFLGIERWLAKRTSAIVTISDIQKHEICNVHKVCPPEKAVVIPLGFDLSRFRENMGEKRKNFRAEYNLADDEIAIAIIGRFAPVKNHALFLRAMQIVFKQSHKKIKAFLIGDGDDKIILENLCHSLGLSFGNKTNLDTNPQVIFTSWIKDIDVALAGCDMVAMTSLNEGTPVSLIEAQAAGKPIVSTNVGGIENVVLSNETALLSESGNEKTFAANTLSLIDNNNLRTMMSQKGWQHVHKNFDYTRLVGDMRKLYLELLSSSHRGY